MSLNYYMVNSKQLINKSKMSIPKMSLRSRSVMQNTSKQSDDNNDELVNTVRGIIKEELEEHEKKLQSTNERLDKMSNEVYTR